MHVLELALEDSLSHLLLYFHIFVDIFMPFLLVTNLFLAYCSWNLYSKICDKTSYTGLCDVTNQLYDFSAGRSPAIQEENRGSLSCFM